MRVGLGGPFPPKEIFLQYTEPGIVVQKAYGALSAAFQRPQFRLAQRERICAGVGRVAAGDPPKAASRLVSPQSPDCR